MSRNPTEFGHLRFEQARVVVGHVQVGADHDVAQALGYFLQRADGVGVTPRVLHRLPFQESEDLEDIGGDDVRPPLHPALFFARFLED